MSTTAATNCTSTGNTSTSARMIEGGPDPVNVLSVLINHDPALLTLRDLGSLCSASHAVATAMDNASIWKTLFETCVANSTKMRDNIQWRHFSYGFKICSWNGEAGLLDCFANPSTTVLEKAGGYKAACGCLFGKTCVTCGIMVGEANPLTLKRLCSTCSEEDQASFLISKIKAKESFLL